MIIKVCMVYDPPRLSYLHATCIYLLTCSDIDWILSTSLSSSESSGTVALVVSIFNMTIGEGNTVQVRITTADITAHGRKEFTV